MASWKRQTMAPVQPLLWAANVRVVRELRPLATVTSAYPVLDSLRGRCSVLMRANSARQT